MEYRPLKITVASAEGIKDMNTFSKQDVYAVVSIAGYPGSKKKTPVDKDCGKKPKWNHHMEFIVDEPFLTNPGHSLLFEIYAESALRSDKLIGSVTVPLDDLFKSNSSAEQKSVEYQVLTDGKPKGILKFSYNFGEKFTQAAETQKNVGDQPVTAYPAPAGHPGAGYPPQQYQPPPQAAYGGYPPQAAYGGYPPQAAYGGYPPQASGYGYQPHAQPSGYGYQAPPPPGYGYPAGYAAYPAGQKPKKNKMGMGAGMGLGLGAGLLGGLLVGEAIDDIGDSMDDMGGDFDF